MQASGGPIRDRTTGLTLDQMLLLTFVFIIVILIASAIAVYSVFGPKIKKLFTGSATENEFISP